MTQYHEGQEVEVLRYEPPIKTRGGFNQWRKAKIAYRYGIATNRTAINGLGSWMVEFPDGERAVFDTDHIREDYGVFSRPEIDANEVNEQRKMDRK